MSQQRGKRTKKRKWICRGKKGVRGEKKTGMMIKKRE